MKNIFKRTYVLIRHRNFLVGLAIVGALAFVLSPIVYLQSQSEENLQESKRILRKGGDFTPPVTITSIKTHLGEIETDTPFAANNDWFKGLSITMRNDSDKPVTYIKVSTLFPTPENKKEDPDLVIPLVYGVNPLPNKYGDFHNGLAESIKPGESVEIKISDYDYEDIKQLLKKSSYPMDIKKIKVYVTTVGFNDETIWMGDRIYKIDKGNQGKLIPIADSLKKKLKN
jgi:hypothetical protein